ncbi:MAG: aminodeoxychorismate/anthranilate synthase component II [Candidatus Bathyarchaeota archaeon]|nr:aminodeoxychorismate/anthranilate synthase component II [Candidatus Bathyarchaeota archaeon]MDH5688221.1 aminodeoxychorismate/anthranilate synthase component II [Candidatus Bathyarchaeota archaeon]
MRTLIIDNYDSFVYNLVQYVGELGGGPIVYRNDQISIDQAKKLQPDRIIISPGPGTPEDPRYFGTCSAILQRMSPKIPTLGVCMGCQGIVHVFGGGIARASRLMHGKTSMIKHDGKGIFKAVKNPLRATRYHSLVAEKASIPSCLDITAEALDDLEVMGVRHTVYPIEGVQFHPESILTEDGVRIIENFLEGV